MFDKRYTNKKYKNASLHPGHQHLRSSTVSIQKLTSNSITEELNFVSLEAKPSEETKPNRLTLNKTNNAISFEHEEHKSKENRKIYKEWLNVNYPIIRIRPKHTTEIEQANKLNSFSNKEQYRLISLNPLTSESNAPENINPKYKGKINFINTSSSVPSELNKLNKISSERNEIVQTKLRYIESPILTKLKNSAIITLKNEQIFKKTKEKPKFNFPSERSTSVEIRHDLSTRKGVSLSNLEEIKHNPIKVLKGNLNSNLQYFYAESYQGKRSYNEDTYLCLTKDSLNLKEKLLFLSSKIHSNSFFQSPKNLVHGQTENFSLFGVFDGHGGNKCSLFLKENFNFYLNSQKNLFIDPPTAIKETFSKIEENFLSFCNNQDDVERSGSCATICLNIKNIMYFGNVGDSRALLLSLKEIKQVTKDHKPDDREEKLRIVRHGGKVYKDGHTSNKESIKIFNHSRIIPGNLNVSRTIGDIEVKLKKYGGLPGVVLPEPDIFIEEIDGLFQYCIIASDGLFEGLSNKEIHEIFIETKRKHPKEDEEKLVKKLTEVLIAKAGEKSGDNITVICFAVPKLEGNEEKSEC